MSRACPRFFVISTVLFLAACSSGSSSNGSGGAGARPSVCEPGEGPCTWSEVAPEVIEASFELGEEAYRRVVAEGYEAARQWLIEQPEVVYTASGSGALRFRIDGGLPVWVTGEPPLFLEDPAPASSAVAPKFVAGQDRTGDDKVNNRDWRQASVLSPIFTWSGEQAPELDFVFGLENVPGYAGQVEHIKDGDADLAAFSDWATKDLVYFVGHGNRVCDDKESQSSLLVCGTGLLTGEAIDPEGLRSLDSPGVTFTVMPNQNLLDVTVPGAYVFLEAPFFEWKYPSGLDDTLIVLMACRAGDGAPADDDYEPSDLVRTLNDAGAVVFSWTDVVWSDYIYETSQALLAELREGRSTEDTIAELERRGLDSFMRFYEPYDRTVTTELVAHGSQERPLRIREVVQLVDEDGKPLTDGTDVTQLLDAGGGASDTLSLSVRFDGLAPDQLGQASLRFELDGSSIGSPIVPSDAQAVPAAGPYTSRLAVRVNTGRELTPDRDYTLEAILDLPEGGESRFEVILGVRRCSWALTGPPEGPADGTFAAYNADEEATVFMFHPDPGGTEGPNVTLILDYIPVPGVNPLGEGSGNLSIFYPPSTAYVAGTEGNCLVNLDGGACEVPSPPAPTLTFDAFDSERAAGTIVGSMYRFTGPDSVDIVDVSIQFEARNQELFNFDVCGGG